MFTSEAEVAAAGMDKFRIVAPFYFMMALFGIFSGVIRGCGQTFVLMPVAYLLSSHLGANGVHWSLSVCWTLEAVVMGLYDCFGNWNKKERWFEERLSTGKSQKVRMPFFECS